MNGTFWTRYEFHADKTTFRVTKYECSRTKKTRKVDVIQHWNNIWGEPQSCRSSHPNLEDVVSYIETLLGFDHALTAMKALRLKNLP